MSVYIPDDRDMSCCDLYKELDSYAKHDGSCCLAAVDFVVGKKD